MTKWILVLSLVGLTSPVNSLSPDLAGGDVPTVLPAGLNDAAAVGCVSCTDGNGQPGMCMPNRHEAPSNPSGGEHGSSHTFCAESTCALKHASGCGITRIQLPTGFIEVAQVVEAFEKASVGELSDLLARFAEVVTYHEARGALQIRGCNDMIAAQVVLSERGRAVALAAAPRKQHAN